MARYHAPKPAPDATAVVADTLESIAREGARAMLERMLAEESAISQDWRGKPLVSHEAIVKLIAATTTRTGLRVRSELDTNAYPKGVTVSDAAMGTLYIRTDPFHGEWNYSFLPRDRLPLD